MHGNTHNEDVMCRHTHTHASTHTHTHTQTHTHREGLIDNAACTYFHRCKRGLKQKHMSGLSGFQIRGVKTGCNEIIRGAKWYDPPRSKHIFDKLGDPRI